MEESTVFNNQQAPVQEPSSLPPAAPPAPSPTIPPPQPPPPAPTMPPPPISGSGGIIKRVIKILGVLLFIIILVFLIVRFVVPIFSQQAGGKVTIVYWGLWEPKQIMQGVINDFQKQNPNITVVYEQRDIKQYKEALTTRIASSEGPDVFRFHNSWTPTLKDVLSPIPQSVIKQSELKEQYFPVVVSDMVIGQALYGLPTHMDTLALFVNDDILSQSGVSVPTTWEEFVNAASTVNVVDEAGKIQTAGAALGSFENIVHAPDILGMLFLQNRVNLKKPSDSVDQIAETLRFYTDFASGRDNIERVWDPKGQSSLVAFAGGNVAMYFGYSWDIFAISAQNPTLKFSIHPVPVLSKQITVSSYWAEGVSNKSKHQKEAMLFLQHLTKKETFQKLYTEESKVRPFGELPARKDLAQTLSKNPLVYPFLQQAEFASSSYFASDTYDESFNGELNTYLGKAISSVLENTSAESAANTLSKGMEQVYTKYGIK